jgi:peptidyl-prolyl cis-trans isomerase B (cyclophilin B)
MPTASQIKALGLGLCSWLLLQVGSGAAFAKDKLDSDLIPPDVTLPTAPYPSTTTGTSSAAAGANPSNPPQQAPSNGPSQGQLATSSGPPVQEIDPQKPDPIAIVETDKGTIVIRLFRKLAPKTVTNFIDIANSGFYNGLRFHRVEPGFCIQGGDPQGDGSGVYVEPTSHQMRLLPLETSPSLKHNAPGVVAMAHFPRNPDTSSCQFYITLSPQPGLDGQYSIFGGVVNGMDVANKIAIGDKIRQITVREQQ